MCIATQSEVNISSAKGDQIKQDGMDGRNNLVLTVTRVTFVWQVAGSDLGCDMVYISGLLFVVRSPST